MKLRYGFFTVSGLLTLSAFMVGPLLAAPKSSCRVTVNAKHVLHEINPLFFGVNTLFWIEDDAALKDGKLAQQLREMPCHLMRFPGGEVADNYHWKTKKLDDIKQFPASEGPDKLDCDKFMILCRQVDAEPIFVVNLESGFLHNNLEAAIQEAADWVRYANKEKGYNVKYWEIGNETDLPVTRYPTTAREYAEAASKFSRAMKAVDPTIKIGFVGPEAPDTVILLDRLSKAELSHERDISRSNRKKDKEALKKLTKNRPGDAWWPALVQIAGQDMDFAIVHRYYPSSFGRAMNAGAPIVTLKQFFANKMPGRTIPVALTEWNSGREIPNCMASALVVAELIGNYLNAGVDMACLWPMRYPAGEGVRSLLDVKTNDPKPAYTVMKLYSSNMGKGSKLIEATASSKSIYTCASLSGGGQHLAVFLLNKSATKDGAAVEINVTGFEGRTVHAETLPGGELKGKSTALSATAVAARSGVLSLTLPPNSLTVITCK